MPNSHRRLLFALLLSLAALAALPAQAQAGPALWSASGSTVTTAATNQLNGHGSALIASDGVGGLYTVWVDSRNVAGTGNLTVYAQHLDATGVAAAGWPANGLQISTTPTRTIVYQGALAGSNILPAVSRDGAGGVIVVWQDWQAGNGDVYAQRINAAGTKLWAAEGVLVSSGPTLGGDQAGAPFLADDGGLFVVFFDSAPLAQGGLNFRVQKLNAANGSPLLEPFGNWIASTTVQGLTGLSNFVTDGANGIIIAWGDRRAGVDDSNAYAARVDGNGVKQWEATLSGAAFDQGVQMYNTPDGAGGLYSVWVDSRAGGGATEIYGTRIQADGTAAPGWTIGAAGGTAITAAAGNQVVPVADHYGSDLIVTWLDPRNSVMEVYSQRMGAGGAAAWAASGVPVFQFTGGLSNVAETPTIVVSSGNLFYGTGWLQVALGCGSVCITELAVGQVLAPADGSRVFGDTGTLMGSIYYNNGGVLPRAYEFVASTTDATALFVWLSGDENTNSLDLFAQKLSTGGAAGGGGGGGGSTTTLNAFLAVTSSDTIIAQWANVPGNNYIAALSTDAFTTLVASITITDTFRSTFTALTPATTYYFKVKIATETDAAYSAVLTGRTSAGGISPPAFSLGWAATGTAAGQVYSPLGLAVDSAGNVYVADQNNHRVQKFDNNGVFVTSWGGFGTADGQFDKPYGLAVDSSGNVFVADFLNSRVQKFSSAGTFLAKWGSLGSGNGQFISLTGIAVDASGNVYTTERGNHRVQKFTGAGAFLAKWGSQGTANGQFKQPWGIGVDGSGNVYVLESDGHRIQRFDSSGAFLGKWGGLGAAAGLVNTPRHLAVDAAGSVYVADLFNYRVQKFDGSGSLLYTLGSLGSTDGKFISITGLAVDSAGNLFTVDASTRPNHIQRFGASAVVPPPPAPANVSFNNVIYQSLGVQWTLESGNSYLMVLASDSGFSSIVSSGTGALNQNTTSYAGLSALTTYYFKVKLSTHPDTGFSTAISTMIPAPPSPRNVAFTAVSTTSLSVQWTLETGNAYVMALATNSAFSPTISSATGILNQNTTTYAINQAGTYYFKVKLATHPDAGYCAAITTTTANAPGSSTDQVISATAETVFTVNPISGPIGITIPAGAFGGANTVTATIPTSLPPPSSGAGGAVTPLGPAIELTLANAVSQFSAAVNLAITILPPASPANVYLAWYDTAFQMWWPIWSSYYSAALQQVIGGTYHFTLFAAVNVAAAATLDDLKVFPNPVNFGTAARRTVKFTGLTAQPTIRIYTVLGELVKTLPPGLSAGADVNNGTSGLAEWSGRNEHGVSVARGTYIYVISDNAGHRRSGRIGVLK